MGTCSTARVGTRLLAFLQADAPERGKREGERQRERAQKGCSVRAVSSGTGLGASWAGWLELRTTASKPQRHRIGLTHILHLLTQIFVHTESWGPHLSLDIRATALALLKREET